MSYSIFQSGRSRRNGTFHHLESGIEEQIEALRDELAELTRLVGKNSRHQSEKLRSQASAGFEELLDRSEDLLRELQHGYERGATEMRETVRNHPLATIGAAAALGLAIAFLARR
ncbi:DUF883 domain-containing protein [Rhizobium sp. S9]|uniref:glycine zipper domain-containing protein n=1 Tax=unclassified Rhizobium TaxID=2613769 RepID=UPI000A2116D6|nr:MULTISPECIES: DUF883 family protein [unclassified Rhizobium]ARO25335.1 hypothetical protein TAL182_CH03606 [Rhizobium sp. TAL182]PDS98014.1 DUF883 domain-containing protein [Rhizobium sp. S9]